MARKPQAAEARCHLDRTARPPAPALARPAVCPPPLLWSAQKHINTFRQPTVWFWGSLFPSLSTVRPPGPPAMSSSLRPGDPTDRGPPKGRAGQPPPPLSAVDWNQHGKGGCSRTSDSSWRLLPKVGTQEVWDWRYQGGPGGQFGLGLLSGSCLVATWPQLHLHLRLSLRLPPGGRWPLWALLPAAPWRGKPAALSAHFRGACWLPGSALEAERCGGHVRSAAPRPRPLALCAPAPASPTASPALSVVLTPSANSHPAHPAQSRTTLCRFTKSS